jgi:hypothetical protein
MLSHEWRELESLCNRLSDLRHRYAAAIRTSNTGLIEGLKSELERTKRLRDLVVQHISARLGSAAADPAHGSHPLDSSTSGASGVPDLPGAADPNRSGREANA